MLYDRFQDIRDLEYTQRTRYPDGLLLTSMRYTLISSRNAGLFSTHLSGVSGIFFVIEPLCCALVSSPSSCDFEAQATDDCRIIVMVSNGLFIP